MAQEVKLWKLGEGDTLKEITKSKLNYEDRLESWLENDISIISKDIMVIGRQVETDFGGKIDLLCLDTNGDLVIVELKRDKTPREITAQALDYASWVKDLDSDRISEIANSYLENVTLEEAFKDKFGEEIPEIVNERHNMLIVASEIDSSSERIIKYLSDSYGVGINAITFHYFQDQNGTEYLSRVYLIEPGEVEYKARTKTSSKKMPSLTYDEFQDIADSKGMGNIFRKIFSELKQHFNQVTFHRTGIAYKGILGENSSKNSIIVLYPTESDSEKGLLVYVYIDRLAEFFNIDKENIAGIFPPIEDRKYQEWAAGETGNIYFKTEADVNKLLRGLFGQHDNRM